MDKRYVLSPHLHFDPSLSQSPMPTWQSNEHLQQYTHFDSAFSSMVSSPAAPTGATTTDSFAIRELIGKLGTICNSGEILPATNNSCYSTPLNSPPKSHDFPRNSIPLNLNPSLPVVTGDPGFAERAAKFSCFGSRSFNSRSSQFGLNNTNNESQYRSSLQRVSSNPSLKLAGSPMGVQENKSPAQVEMNCANDAKFNRLPSSTANSNDDSSVSEQNPSGENGFKSQNDINSRKRKPISRGKRKEESPNATKKAEDEDSNSKRSKLTERNAKAEEETKAGANEGQKQEKNSPKPPEPPKDYIHVRARRGQATDSHSLAERVRREKISERMKLLQDLVPGCNKVTGKALMLDEIINYVQSLQCQVEFLSMKLASVNPRLDINMDSILSKDIFQPNASFSHQNHAINSSALFGHQNQQVHNNVSNGAVDPLGLQLPQIDVFGEPLPQFSTFCEDDLQSIVQMGFGDNPNSDRPFQLQSFTDAAQNQTSQMKIEL
ncbi:hypothetical protein LguiB_000524 [Lonicera macranthoides]